MTENQNDKICIIFVPPGNYGAWDGQIILVISPEVYKHKLIHPFDMGNQHENVTYVESITAA